MQSEAHPLFSCPDPLQIIVQHYVAYLVHERVPQPDAVDGSTYDFNYREAFVDIRKNVSQVRTVSKAWLAWVPWGRIFSHATYDVQLMAYHIPQLFVTVATSDTYRQAYSMDAFRYFYGPVRAFSEEQAPLTDEVERLYYTNPSTSEKYSIFTEMVTLYDVTLGKLYVTGHVHPRDRFNIEVPDGAPSTAIEDFSSKTFSPPDTYQASTATLRILTFRDEACNHSITYQPLAYLILPHSSSYNESIIEQVLASHYSLDDDVVLHVDAERQELPMEWLAYHQGADEVLFNRCCHIPITRYEEYCECCSCAMLLEARNRVQIG